MYDFGVFFPGGENVCHFINDINTEQAAQTSFLVRNKDRWADPFGGILLV